MAKLILFNKPYQVLSQFTDREHSVESSSQEDNSQRKTLADFIKQKSIYPAGRLDYDSEGLLLLTDDGNLQNQISHPKHKLPKTYWVQVEGAPDQEAITALKNGVKLNDGPSKPAKVSLIETPALWERTPPVRFRQNIPTHWLSITITEGRNRQVRRMTAAVGLPTLRLIRYAIGQWTIEGLMPGESSQQLIHLANPSSTSPKKTTRSNFKKTKNKGRRNER